MDRGWGDGWVDTLPEGYEFRTPAKLARSTRSRFTRDWYFMLRDLYENGGYGWQHWGSGHMSSGITKALTARRFIETAESTKGPLYFRLTRAGYSKLQELYEEKAEWAETHDEEYTDPTPPEGAPLQPLKQPEPTREEKFDATLDRMRERSLRTTIDQTGAATWNACGHRAELDINEHCYTCGGRV